MKGNRIYIPGGRFFFTVVTAHRKPILIDNIERLRYAFRLCMKAHPFKIESIVILPDHIHAIWKLPEGDADYSMRWMLIKRTFSIGLQQRTVSAVQHKKRGKGIWHSRFWDHYIRDEEDWQRIVNYIHMNPVKHGYVKSPEEWPYSSYHRDIKI